MILITFSGLDGCGKSTHVERTCAYLHARGLRTCRLVTLRSSVTGMVTLFRERILHRPVHAGAAAKARPSKTTEPGTGCDTAPAPRVRRYARGRSFDEDCRRLTVRLQRWVAYPFDCLVLTTVLGLLRIRGYEAVVCDRYIHDKAVNLPDPTGRLWRLMRRLVPQPHLAIFLDAPPEVASTRRCEHEPDYYVTKYAGYRRLVAAAEGSGAAGLRPYPSRSIEETQRAIEGDLAPILARPSAACRSSHPATT